ncbi:MAG: hypothetical protein ACP5IB_03590 [Thermoplasmata archaeon]
MDLITFSEIKINKPEIEKNKISTDIILNNKESFKLKFTYQENIEDIPGIENLANMLVSSPIINYGLFTEKIYFDFPLSKEDIEYIKHNMDIISADIYVNRFLRVNNPYIIEGYLPNKDHVNIEDSKTKAKIEVESIEDFKFQVKTDDKKVAILSSGGKESLLTYGLLNEMGFETHPMFFNESGGHWKTALPSYRYFSKNIKNTSKVWSNLDRFYLFMLDSMKFIKKNHRRIWSDNYPIRLFIFGPYIFAFLPLVIRRGIGNILLGSEYDDVRAEKYYHGIRHYYGIYDQSADFDYYNTDYFKSKNLNIRQWSIVRPITGLIVEGILMKRYNYLYKLQRSCHSCHYENNDVYPCGKCSKCLGIISFILANDGDPRDINYKDEHIENLENNISKTILKLDQDEKEHVFYILSKKGFKLEGKEHDHVEKIHIDESSPLDLIPENFRRVFLIYKDYVKGVVKYENGDFVDFNDFFDKLIQLKQ